MTRDYGSKTLVDEAEDDPPSSETVIRFLDREAEITTRYGGGFVQSIDGLAGTESGGRRYDWFFYVNGVESAIGSAEVHVRGGDRIWWDYRDWTDAMRVPAVVGSWPEPFAQASTEGDRQPVRVECLAGGSACEAAANRLADAGVESTVERGEGERRAAPGHSEFWSARGARCATTGRSTRCAVAQPRTGCSRPSRARSTAPSI